jgi:hypothetical protein
MSCQKDGRKTRILSNLRCYSCSSRRKRCDEKDLNDLEDEVPILRSKFGLRYCRLSGQLGNI